MITYFRAIVNAPVQILLKESELPSQWSKWDNKSKQNWIKQRVFKQIKTSCIGELKIVECSLPELKEE